MFKLPRFIVGVADRCDAIVTGLQQCVSGCHIRAGERESGKRGAKIAGMAQNRPTATTPIVIPAKAGI